MKRYEKYKNSGVDWIGEIPEEWKPQKFKRIFREKKKEIDSTLNCGSISFGTVVYKDDEKVTEATKQSYQVVRKDDFLLNPLNMNYDLKSLRIALSTLNLVVSSGYIVLKPVVKIDLNYFRWFLRIYDIFFMKTLGAGVRQTINFNDLADTYLLFPPLSEQQSIALFLDEKTAKIDQTISIKEKEILLLKERRQILIQKAVTKGLIPNVKLKNSGVDWIGEIPEHWEVLPGFNVYKENKTNNIGMKEKVVLSLSYGNIVIKPEEKLVGLVPESFETYQIVKPGDIIIRCMDLQNDKTSLRTGIAVNDGIITNAYLNLNIINGNNSNYYYNFLHTLDTTKVIYKFGKGLRQNLSYVDFKRMQIIVPPKIEQNEIANHIEKLKIKISKAISLKQQEIEKLKEYKTVLVDNVVTGKVRV